MAFSAEVYVLFSVMAFQSFIRSIEFSESTRHVIGVEVSVIKKNIYDLFPSDIFRELRPLGLNRIP